LSDKELREQLYWEAEQYIPFNVHEVNLDFVVLDKNLKRTGKMEVLLVVAKKDYVKSLTALIESAGLIPEVIDSQAFALGNVYEFNYPGFVTKNSGFSSVIIDFGAGTTKISIVEDDRTVFTRELRQSGNSASLMISDRLGLSFEDAEIAKIQQSTQPAVKSILNEYNILLVDEISKTLDFWSGQNSSGAIQGIFICGGGSKNKMLIEELTARMTSPIEVLNPVQNIVGSGKKMNDQAIQELSYLGAVAIGLGLRSRGELK
jgi:type IV pilus assembly protein PilM